MSKRLVGITVEKVLVVVPVADSDICVTNEQDCCSSGSGSGSGSGCGACIVACDQCASISSEWTLYFDSVLVSTLNYVCDPDDGNYCRFISADLQWDFRFDYDTGLWVLTNLNDLLDDRRIWYVDAAGFNCTGTNELTAFDAGQPNAVIAPLNTCVSYNCEGSGSGAICVEVAGSGGMYSTLAACEAACGGQLNSCCGGVLIPNVLFLTITDCGGSSPYTLTWNASGFDGPGWYSRVVPCGGGSVQYRWWCDTTSTPQWALKQFCNGSSAGVGGGGSLSCGPPFSYTGGVGAFSGVCSAIAPVFTVHS